MLFSLQRSVALWISCPLCFVRLGPPAEPAGVYAIQSSIGTSSLQLSWTVGAANGGSILFHTVEAMPVMSNEWYIAVARKYKFFIS